MILIIGIVILIVLVFVWSLCVAAGCADERMGIE